MKKKLMLVLSLLVFAVFRSTAQNDNAILEKILTEDSTAVNALVLYPDSTRRSILEASQFPEVLLKMQSMQENSQKEFNTILSPYTQEVQQVFYNLTRYPGLINQLVAGGKKSKSQLQNIADNYPDEIKDDAVVYGKKYFDVLNSIDQFSKKNNSEFENVISTYSNESNHVFRDLVELPEVLNILTDNIKMTVMIGDLYRRNPTWVLHKTDSLNMEAARQHAEELADWKKKMDEDPDAKKQLEESAKKYADENGYRTDVYSSPRTDVFIDHYLVYPYPYWFGYPGWYPHYYWYPYPYWYDWGFYYGPYGQIIIFNYPSYYFTYWFFYHPMNFYHYPYLCNHFVNHYYGHHHSYMNGNAPVRNWVNQNEKYFSKDFATNDLSRINQIKEFGQLQKDVSDYNVSRPANQQLTTQQYIQTYKEKYPDLNVKPTVQPMESKDQWFQQPPAKQPPIKVPSPTQKDKQPIQIPQNQPTPFPQPKFDQNKNAQDFHKQTWEQNRPPVFTPKVNPQPIPKQQPKSTPQPKTDPPKTQKQVTKPK